MSTKPREKLAVPGRVEQNSPLEIEEPTEPDSASNDASTLDGSEVFLIRSPTHLPNPNELDAVMQRDKNEEEQTDLIPVFVPALAAILIHAEDEKGSPLTFDEAINLRDGSTCIMMTPAHALKMDESRGYCDIDPENCWFEWQMLRRELGREPELDAG